MWTTEELDRYIDDGYLNIAERTGLLVREDTISCAANDHYIELPSDTLYPIAARDTSTNLPIDLVPWTFFDSQDIRWSRLSDSRPAYLAAWALTHVVIYPAYNAASSMELSLAYIPAAFSQDVQEPDIPEDFHQALVHYTHYRALLKDADGPRLGRALRQLAYYEEVVAAAGGWAGERHQNIQRAISTVDLRVPERIWGKPVA